MASSLASASSCAPVSGRRVPRSGAPRSRRQQHVFLQNARCSAEPQAEQASTSTFASSLALGRRHACVGMAGGVLAAALADFMASGAEALSAKPIEVGSYLPRASDGDFCVFRASTKDTPALRAGNVDPYEFFVPPRWKQAKVANILSGNYCQPKCAEPWVEVKFEDEREGTLQLFAAPMVRLTNKPNAKIEEIGSPDTVIAALGPFVTGNSFDPEELVESVIQQRADRTFYTYELDAPYARTGSHNLASATAKGSVVLLLVVSANEKQWASSQGRLRQILNSFSV